MFPIPFPVMTEDVIAGFKESEIPPLIDVLRLMEHDDPVLFRHVRDLAESMQPCVDSEVSRSELVRAAVLFGGSMTWVALKHQDHRNRNMN